MNHNTYEIKKYECETSVLEVGNSGIEYKTERERDREMKMEQWVADTNVKEDACTMPVILNSFGATT